MSALDLWGTPIIGKKPLNLAHRGGTNAEAHRRYMKANAGDEARGAGKKDSAQ